jgi:membrane fusion protein (multidrug efflux system)
MQMQTRVETGKKPKTWKRMTLMIIGVIVLIAIVAGVKVMQVMKMMAGFGPPPPSVVSTAKATTEDWQPELKAVGSLRAVRGADLALDMAGLVTDVNLKSGDDVKEGQVLVQLRSSEDEAQLRQLEASSALAEVTFNRAKQQLDAQAISKADYDTAAADLKGKQAAVAQQRVNVARKALRAPFAGRAGIVTVNPGAYLNSGTVIVTVQQTDPVFVDFFMPQKNLSQLKVGQKIALSLDAYPGKAFEGTLSAISPKVDSQTRNVQIEATVPNPDHVLAPGMFANVAVEIGEHKKFLTLPQTAVVYNPYGETVYVVRKKSDFDKDQAEAQKSAAASAQKPDGKMAEPKKDDKKAEPKKDEKKDDPNQLVVQQTFVTTSGTRGDQVAVTKGLDEGAEVVTSGQIKLKNGAPVKVDNSVQPANNPNPTPQEN